MTYYRYSVTKIIRVQVLVDSKRASQTLFELHVVSTSKTRALVIESRCKLPHLKLGPVCQFSSMVLVAVDKQVSNS